ncbi:sulfotransferase family protein [Tundrisphaera sp. TA3]|uniref:sulfotransferase family protein n=1 Tax=Tundrisphaera sp. TA3 TaxID=3435775 RepID=UPI003EB69560
MGSDLADADRSTDASAAPIWEPTFQPRWLKLINRASALLLGRDRPRLDADAMIARARRATGLVDFGPDEFRESLGVLVDAFSGREDVHAFGRLAFRKYCEGLLESRLRIRDDLKRHPEILDVPITAPVFIVGLPRSGTTFLQRLMSTDPAARVMQFWEALWPSPPPTSATYATDPRIARARRQVALLDRVAPGVAAGHELGATLPEEDNSMFARDFRAAIFGFMYDVPDYILWLDGQDRLPGYRSHKRELQLLSWRCPGNHWVLKAPTHLYGLDTLLQVYPDARVVMTHRDPEKVVPSVCRLAANFRGMLVDRIELRRLGAEFVEAVGQGSDRAIGARATLDPARFHDVSYDDLVADPIGAVRGICDRFGLDFSPGFEAGARRHLGEHPQGRRGVHRYGLDDFGLDRATVHRFFAAYRAWTADRGISTGGPA